MKKDNLPKKEEPEVPIPDITPKPSNPQEVPERRLDPIPEKEPSPVTLPETA